MTPRGRARALAPGDGGGDPGDAGDPQASPPPARPKRRSGGVVVVAGGLLQDLEERLRRDLAPVELRVRPGEELRGLAGGTARGSGDPVVIVLPTKPAGPGAGGPDDH